MEARNKKKVNYSRMISGIRVSEADYAKLKRDAEKVGVRFAEHIRQLLTTGKSVNTDALALLRKEINKIGVNINQIAHACNAQGYDPEMYDEIIKELVKLRERINAI
jgi:DNA polymerase/3'-5' exonuclease PolX